MDAKIDPIAAAEARVLDLRAKLIASAGQLAGEKSPRVVRALEDEKLQLDYELEIAINELSTAREAAKAARVAAIDAAMRPVLERFLTGLKALAPVNKQLADLEDQRALANTSWMALEGDRIHLINLTLVIQRVEIALGRAVAETPHFWTNSGTPEPEAHVLDVRDS